MKKQESLSKIYSLFLLVLLLLCSSIKAQISGVFNIPSGTYPTIASAIAALNTSGVAAPGATFNVAANHTETFPTTTSGQIDMTPALPNATRPVVFQKNGSGANPLVTSALGNNSSNLLDGIIVLNGISYITFNGIDLIENPANNLASSHEWGYALLKASGTQGSNNVKIINCRIGLNTNNTISTGIYSNNHSPTSTTQIVVSTTNGTNSYNTFYGNRIINVCRGIFLQGYNDPTAPFQLYDQNTRVGDITQTKNSILATIAVNALTLVGIHIDWQNNITVENDSIYIVDAANAMPPAGNGPVGINLFNGTNSNASVNNNTISINAQYIASYPGWGIRNNLFGNAGTNNLVDIHHNIIRDVNWPFTGIGNPFRCIDNSATVFNLNIANNFVTNITQNGPGGFQGIRNNVNITNTLSIVSNTLIGNNVFGTALSASFVHNAGTSQANLIKDNLIENNTVKGLFSMIWLAGASSNSVIANTIRATSVTGSLTVNGIRVSNSGSNHIDGNKIDVINSNTTSINGINIFAGTTQNIYNNKITSLSSNGSTVAICGILAPFGTSLNIVNNMIGNLTAPATNNVNALTGMSLTSSGTINAYFNTIQLNGSSTGTNFGSTGIYTHVNTITTLNNNLIVNTSTPNGTGLSVAHTRSGSGLTNLSTTSNYNSYFVSSGANRHIYFDGTAYTTLANYMAAPGMNPREINSINTNPTFFSITDLHTNDNLVNNKGISITGFNTDYDSQTRSCPPEIGADEFTFGAPIVNVAATSTAVCIGNSVTLTATSANATAFSWLPGPLTGSAVVVNPTTPTNYTVTASYPGSCTSSTIISISILPNPVVNASSNPTAICVGNTATLTATGALSYTWNLGNFIGQVFNVSPTSNSIYSVTATNANGCTGTATVQVTVNPNPTVNVSANPVSICAGNSSTLTASGANAYVWSTSATTSSISVTPAATTVYTVTGTSVGCTDTKTVSVTINANPTVTASSSSTAICNGSSATLTASGATNYTWMPVNLIGSSISVTPSVSTTYTLVGNNAAGCTSNTIISIVVNPNPTVSVNNVTICPSSTATLIASGANSYLWSTSATTSSITVSPSSNTTYTVTGTSFGCSHTKTVSVTIGTGVSINISATPTVICAGASATLTASGATTYTWSNTSNSSSIVVNPSSTTIYSITGSVGSCTGSGSISLVVNPNPTLNVLANPVSICAGNSSTLTASGANSYVWSTSATTSSISVTPATTTVYTVTGTSLGCTDTKTVNVTVNPNPTVSVSNVTICPASTATLIATGANTYLWSTSATTSSIVVSPAANTVYTVTGTSLGCSNTKTVSVTIGTGVSISISATPTVICVGGSATLTAIGATSYTWSNASNSSSIIVNPVLTSIYSVTGSVGSCSGSNTISLVVNPNPTVNVSANPVAVCSGSSSTLTASGASSYVWSTSATTNSISVTPTSSTVYTVTGTSLGCTATKTLNVTVNPTPTLSVNNVTICPSSTATLFASGANTYLWNTSATTSFITVSPAANTVYTVTGTSLGCSNTKTVSVSIGSGVSINISSTPTAVCVGGSATLTASGATNYTWSTSSNASSIVVNPSSTSTYSITGSVGSCTGTGSIVVVVNPNPTVNVSANPVSICAGNSSTLTASGANSYLWSTSATTNSISVTPASTTNYTVIGTSLGCSNTKTINVTVNPIPTINITAAPLTLCAGGSSTLSATGANSYVWNTSATTSSISVSPSSSTIYTVTGTTLGCSSIATINLVVNPVPTVVVSANPFTICAGASSTLTANGASSYVWSTSQTNSPIIVTPASTTVYTVTGNSAGCSSIATVTVVVGGAVNLSVSATPSLICSGQSSTLTASGANSYLWNTSSTSNSISVIPPGTTTYSVTGTIGLCSVTKTVSIFVFTSPTINVSASPNPICPGGNATISASGASQYSVNSNAIINGSTSVNPAATTIYTVVGMSGSCADTKTVQVNVNPQPTITIASSQSLICKNQSATITASGANTYTWNTTSNAPSIIVTPSANSVYNVIGSNGSCTTSASYTLLIQDCTGIKEQNGHSISLGVFPNPSHDQITITCNAVLEKISIVTLDGKIVESENADSSEVKKDISHLTMGMYFIIVQTNGQSKTFKFIKE